MIERLSSIVPAVIVTTVWLVAAPAASQEGGPPDMSSADIRPLEAHIYPIQGLARGTQAAISSIEERATELAGRSAAITATKQDEGVRLSVEGDVLFEFDSDAVRADAEPVLSDLAALLAEIDVGAVVVEGHTDSIGSDAYNQDLSERRAASVVDWLQGRGGIDGVSFETVGHGSSRPVEENTHPDGSDNPEGRAQNRRVEFLFENRQE